MNIGAYIMDGLGSFSDEGIYVLDGLFPPSAPPPPGGGRVPDGPLMVGHPTTLLNC